MSESKEDFEPTLLLGDEAADALITITEPSRHRSIFDVYRAYGWPESDQPGAYTTAKQAWSLAKHVHPFDIDGENIPPRGAPVYWGNTDREHPGLIGISAGSGLVAVSTVDPERVIVVGINWVSEQAGLSYLGWAEDFMGNPVLWSGRLIGV